MFSFLFGKPRYIHFRDKTGLFLNSLPVGKFYITESKTNTVEGAYRYWVTMIEGVDSPAWEIDKKTYNSIKRKLK